MAVKMSAEYGDDVVVLLAEAQGSKEDAVQRLALERKWFGKGVMWTGERPVPASGSGIPKFVLLDIEGRPILSGNPLSMHKDIEAAIAAELKKRKKGPKGLRKELKDAWKSATRGKWSDAITAAEKVAEEAGDDAALAEIAQSFADLWREQATSAVERVGRLVAQGDYQRAEDLLEDLDGQLVALPDVERTSIELVEQLGSDELAGERLAEKALRKMEQKLFSVGSRKFKAKSLDRLIEKYPDTKAAARAQELLGFLEG